MAKDGMIFYKSFSDALKNLPDNIRLLCYDAIFAYGIYGIEPELEGIAAAIIALIKPQIDANNKRRENGLKGGRPETKPKADISQPESETETTESQTEIIKNQTETEPKPNENQTETKPEPKEKVKVKEKVKDNNIYINTLSGKPDRAGMRLEIVGYLNAKTGKDFRHSTKSTVSLIEARLNEGYTIKDFKKVIDNKVEEWKGTEQEKYLRPETLFTSAHFESYLNQRQIKAKGTLSNEMTHDYNMDELRKRAKE